MNRGFTQQPTLCQSQKEENDRPVDSTEEGSAALTGAYAAPSPQPPPISPRCTSAPTTLFRACQWKPDFKRISSMSMPSLLSECLRE